MWMELNNVEKEIVQIIAQHDIRWLVKGAATDKHYSKYETSTTVTQYLLTNSKKQKIINKSCRDVKYVGAFLTLGCWHIYWHRLCKNFTYLFYFVMFPITNPNSSNVTSKKLSELKSKKTTFVCQQTPVSCHIWFACNGCLIYTRYLGILN
ncbi:U-box domain-containing protein 32-like [Camellia sinensis]|uniref:U-box domain-containing protein 32-like n=1 Tax=Camellia sinensis TaxID=4442 RepID=UPI0010358950|nr:U-box domain-containing protein 32-like [Camellia sinensis]